MSLVEEKKAAREAAIARRDAAHASLGERAPGQVADNFIRAFCSHPSPFEAQGWRGGPAGVTISAYWPGRSELDIRPLMTRLHDLGHPIGLPVVMGRGKPLVFRLWRPGDALEPKPFGLQEPYLSAPELVPAVLLVPFLAFDGEGYRIGYGAGFYDRTLAILRARSSVLAIGVGYAAQAVAHLPRGEHDERLDWVVTEEGVLEAPRVDRVR
jgi:5-formyltetrahydrofolate cyclo-ligase